MVNKAVSACLWVIAGALLIGCAAWAVRWAWAMVTG